MLTIYILGETRPPRACMRALPRHHRSRRTRTALIACGAALTLLLQLLTSFQLESNLNSWFDLLLFAPMSSGAVHRRYACMGCNARSNGRGEPTFFNDYQSAATHYSHSIHCNKSIRGTKSVAVQPLCWTPVPSSLAAARPEEAELLASGAPNPHQLAAQVT